MQEIKLREDYIKLGQALKACGLVSSGIEAKIVIQDGEVKVNGEVDTRRGKKLVDGDIVEFNGETIKVIKLYWIINSLCSIKNLLILILCFIEIIYVYWKIRT